MTDTATDARRVLELLAEQKITIDDAERLLQALRSPQAQSAGSAPRWFLKIAVTRPKGDGSGKEDVNVRVPIGIIRSGMRLGAIIPGFARERVHARLRERGVDIDLAKLDPAMIESLIDELGEANIDIDSGKAQVRITCE